MHSTAAIGGQLRPASATARHGLDLGLACQFAARLPGHAQMPVGQLVTLLQNAQRVGQFKVYLNGYDECVGYVAWAFLTPDVEDALIAGEPRELAEWEFNDGTSPWVLDLAVAPGSLPYVLQDLRDTVFRHHPHLTYCRTRHERRTCKRVSRDDRTSFMAAGRTGGLA